MAKRHTEERTDVETALGHLSVSDSHTSHHTHQTGTSHTTTATEVDVFEFDPEKEEQIAGQTQGRLLPALNTTSSHQQHHHDEEKSGHRKRAECSPWVGQHRGSDSDAGEIQTERVEPETDEAPVFLAGGLTPHHKAVSRTFSASASVRREAKRLNTSATPVAFRTQFSEEQETDTTRNELKFQTDVLDHSVKETSPIWTLTDSQSLTPASTPEAAPIKLALIATPESSQHITSDDHFPHQESVRRWLALLGACPSWNDPNMTSYKDTYKPHLGVLRRKAYPGACWIGVPSTESLLRPREERIESFPHIPAVQISDILRVHEYSYVQHIASICSRLQATNKNPSGTDSSTDRGNPPPTVHSKDGNYKIPVQQAFSSSENRSLNHPLSDWIQKLPVELQPIFGLPDHTVIGQLDNDSPISIGSWNAAVAGASAAVHAVDVIAQGYANRAFVISRPPGHHAGPHGSVAPLNYHCRPFNCSSGFCLFNNIAIAAAYARAHYGRSELSGRPALQRIAIVDLDIHHGNGTEAIVRNLKPHHETLPLPASWGTQTFYSYKPWLNELDAKETLFASIHMHDGDLMYPGSGSQNAEGQAAGLASQSDCQGGDLFGAPHTDGIPSGFEEWENCRYQQIYNAAGEENPADGGILNIPLSPVGPFANMEREKLKSTERKKNQLQARREFRKAVRESLVPALNSFQPSIIFISAGFDGHTRDFYYHLTSADYAWATRKLVEVANRWSQGRIISVLEGGYNTDLPPQSTECVEAWDLAELWNQEHTLQRENDDGKNSDSEMSPASTVASQGNKTKRKQKAKQRQTAKKTTKGASDDLAEPPETATSFGASVDHPDLQPGSFFGIGDSAFAQSVSAHVETLLQR